MKYLLLAVVTLIFSSLVYGISDGTYVGKKSSRVNLSSYEDSGTYQYELIFTDDYGSQPIGFQSASSSKLEEGKIYNFKQNGSIYSDEKPSECIIQASFLDGVLDINTRNGCIDYIGQYAFSEKASFVPEQYWGKWDKTPICHIYTIIRKNLFNLDIDFGAAVVVNVELEKDGSHSIVGVEKYEDFFSKSEVNLKTIGNKLKIKGEHHGSKIDDVLVRCK